MELMILLDAYPPTLLAPCVVAACGERDAVNTGRKLENESSQMSKRTYRRFTAEEKASILKEAEQPGVSKADVCRKHAIALSLLYNWRSVRPDAENRMCRKSERP
jgi:hypothetical protein